MKLDRPDDDSPLRDEGVKRSFDLPELIHNLDLLVSMSEEQILNNNRRSTGYIYNNTVIKHYKRSFYYLHLHLFINFRLQHEKDLEVNLKHESNKLTDICAQEAKEVNRLKDVFEIIEE